MTQDQFKTTILVPITLSRSALYSYFPLNKLASLSVVMIFKIHQLKLF